MKNKWIKVHDRNGVQYNSSCGKFFIRWGFAGLYSGFYEQDGKVKKGGREDHGYIVYQKGEDGSILSNRSKGFSSIAKAKHHAEERMNRISRNTA